MRYVWLDQYLIGKAGVTKELLDKLYHLVLSGFSKKKQKEILGNL